MDMRMLMVKPVALCNRHLLGEHEELHKIAEMLTDKSDITTYIERGMIEPRSVGSRHDELVAEMENRNMEHNTPLEQPNIDHLPEEQRRFMVLAEHSIHALFSRCKKCRVRRGYL